MKKIYFSPLIHETVVGVEVGFCGSRGSVYIDFSNDSRYDNIMTGDK